MSENHFETAPATAGGNEKNGWERDVIEKIALSALNEQRKTRRWSIFFKILTFLYLGVVLWLAIYPRLAKELGDASTGHTAVIDVVGEIAEGVETNAANIIKGLRNAVKDKGTKGILIHMNTPGGSPVQSANVFNEIRRIKEKNPDLPIYAVVSDICASGGYYIAAAADKIFVSQASIVGSIGVLMNGFGFVQSMDKLGVERRLLIAGSHKAIMDPFSPVNKEESLHMQKLLDQVHQQFIGAVREGRGNRLKENSEMFSGLVWTGAESIKLGLTDEIGTDDYVASEVIGAKKLVNFTHKEQLLDRLAGRFGTSFGQAFSSIFQGLELR